MNFDSLTLEEVETIEQLTGLSIDTIMDAGKPRGKVLRSFVWIMGKRANPSYSIEDAGKVSLTEAVKMFNGEPDPKG